MGSNTRDIGVLFLLAVLILPALTLAYNFRAVYVRGAASADTDTGRLPCGVSTESADVVKGKGCSS